MMRFAISALFSVMAGSYKLAELSLLKEAPSCLALRASSARASHSEVRGRSALPFRERSVSVATADSSQPVYSLYTVLGRKKKRFPAFLPKIFIDVTNVTDIYGQNRTRRNRSHFSGDIYVGTIDPRALHFINTGSP
jgi:hypothetical protein